MLEVTVIWGVVPSSEIVLELMVTARPDTESQAVAAAVGLKVRVSTFVQATPADCVWVQAGTLNE